MDYSQMKEICGLYDKELALMDEYSEDLNDDVKQQEMMSCHQQRITLQGDADLAVIYESVNGLNNQVTIDLYIEKAEGYGTDYEKMIPIYEHILEGCREIWGEFGEKTIECKLQIVVCAKGLAESIEQDETDYRLKRDRSDALHNQILDILEELIASPYRHKLYGNFIHLLLCDEYMISGKVNRAYEVFRKWSETHPITQIKDVEETKCWIEYARVLAEIGLLKDAVESADTLCNWIDDNHDEYKEEYSEFIRSLSEIYVTCTLYHKAVEIIEKALKRKDVLNSEADGLFLLRTQLAHCYSLDGERIKAADLIVELRKTIDDTTLSSTFRLQFDNIQGLIEGMLGDHEQQYQRMVRAFEDSRFGYGENNDITVLYENNLGEVCFELYNNGIGNKDEYLLKAEEYLRDTLYHSEYSRGKNNYFSLLVRRNLAEVIAAKGNFEEAIRMMKEVWEMTSNALTEDNDETVSVKIRYAALALEMQQLYDDVPEWIDEIDPEPILKDGFQKKARNLGMKHWETLDTLYWYIRALQSKELTEYLEDAINKKIKSEYFAESLRLHKVMFENISDMINQAYYINSVAKQNSYMELLEMNLYQFFWLIANSRATYNLEEIYEMVAGYKNISFDMQWHKYANAGNPLRKSLAEDTTTVGEDTVKNILSVTNGNTPIPMKLNYVQSVSAKVKEYNDVYLDIWQEAQNWFVFIIDRNGICLKEINPLNDDEIPSIDEETYEPQPQIDDLIYDRVEQFDIATKFAEELKDDLKGYHRVYYNLQKQLLTIPIGNFIYKYTGIPTIEVPSIVQFVMSGNEQTSTSADITFIEDDISTDYQIARLCAPDHIQSADIYHIPQKSNTICVSGHGFYDDDTNLLEGMRNYITLDNGHNVRMTDIISNDMSSIILAILPVCHTGTGTIYSNFGSYSIGKAFMMAGVRYTIETLWDVAYSASVIFEYEFFQRYCHGANIIDAYYHALDRLRYYTEDDLKEFCRFVFKATGNKELTRIIYTDLSNGTNPYENEEFWAGFILTRS